MEVFLKYIPVMILTIRLSKTSFAIASSIVSAVMSFIFKTTTVKFACAGKIPEKYINREIYQRNI